MTCPHCGKVLIHVSLGIPFDHYTCTCFDNPEDPLENTNVISILKYRRDDGLHDAGMNLYHSGTKQYYDIYYDYSINQFVINIEEENGGLHQVHAGFCEPAELKTTIGKILNNLALI